MSAALVEVEVGPQVTVAVQRVDDGALVGASGGGGCRRRGARPRDPTRRGTRRRRSAWSGPGCRRSASTTWVKAASRSAMASSSVIQSRPARGTVVVVADDAGVEHRGQHARLRAEHVVDGLDGDAGALGDALHRRADVAPLEERPARASRLDDQRGRLRRTGPAARRRQRRLRAASPRTRPDFSGCASRLTWPTLLDATVTLGVTL